MARKYANPAVWVFNGGTRAMEVFKNDRLVGDEIE